MEDLQHNAFDFSLGLINPRPATKAIAKFMCKLLDAEGAQVLTSSFSRHSELSTSSVGDVVLIRDGGALDAGQIWTHAEVQGVTMAVVQELEIDRTDPANGTSFWRKRDAYNVVAVEDIIDPVTWNDFDADVVRIIMPIDIECRLHR